MIIVEAKKNYFKGLKKADPSKFNDNKPLPPGYITDGWGNVYKIPTSGYSDFYTTDDGKCRLRYNFSKQGIEIYLKTGKKWEYETLVDFRVKEWFDNPEYWFEEVSDNLEYYGV